MVFAYPIFPGESREITGSRIRQDRFKREGNHRSNAEEDNKDAENNGNNPLSDLAKIDLANLTGFTRDSCERFSGSYKER